MAWTDAYVFFTDRKPGITASLAMRDREGKVLGVAGIDIALERLSHFLAGLKVGRTGKAMILDGSGRLVAYPDTERMLEWQKIRSGSCDIVVGTRSAVFAPARSLGIVIVDEEQEPSYCSEQNPRYDAVAVAAFRARETGAHLLLASATPSVESYYRAQTGVYNLVSLDERYGSMPLPACAGAGAGVACAP